MLLALGLCPMNDVARGQKEAREGGGITTDLIARARAGDGEAFRQLIDPYRRDLQVRCYRLLGSAHDAEDALQETLLAAWQAWVALRGVPRFGPGCTGSRPAVA